MAEKNQSLQNLRKLFAITGLGTSCRCGIKPKVFGHLAIYHFFAIFSSFSLTFGFGFFILGLFRPTDNGWQTDLSPTLQDKITLSGKIEDKQQFSWHLASLGIRMYSPYSLSRFLRTCPLTMVSPT